MPTVWAMMERTVTVLSVMGLLLRELSVIITPSTVSIFRSANMGHVEHCFVFSAGARTLPLLHLVPDMSQQRIHFFPYAGQSVLKQFLIFQQAILFLLTIGTRAKFFSPRRSAYRSGTSDFSLEAMPVIKGLTSNELAESGI